MRQKSGLMPHVRIARVLVRYSIYLFYDGNEISGSWFFLARLGLIKSKISLTDEILEMNRSESK